MELKNIALPKAGWKKAGDAVDSMELGQGPAKSGKSVHKSFREAQRIEFAALKLEPKPFAEGGESNRVHS